MFFNSYDLTSFLLSIGYLVVLAGAIVIIVLLVRLVLAATRTLNAITAERTLRLDLLLAADDATPAKE